MYFWGVCIFVNCVDEKYHSCVVVTLFMPNHVYNVYTNKVVRHEKGDEYACRES